MKEKGASGTEPESVCLFTQDQAGPLGLWPLASSPVAMPVTCALVMRNCSCPCRSLPAPTQLFQEDLVNKCKLCPEIRERYFRVKPRSIEVLQNLKQWQANLVHQPACTVTGTPATCKAHCTEGDYVLTFSHSANSSGDPRCCWGWCDATCVACLSSTPSASKASKGFASTGGLTSLHIWLGCANKQKEAASPHFFLIPESERNKADEQGSLIVFCRAPQFSVNRDPESVIPCQRLSTIHWQGTINLNVLL